MAITRATIMDAASDESYRRGQDIFLISRRILDFETDIHPYTRIPYATATILDADDTPHDVQISIDEDQNAITGCYCDCDDFKHGASLCKHCVALLLKYISARQLNKLPDTRLSSRHEIAGEDMIRAYAVMDMKQPEGDSKTGNISIEPVIHYNYGHMSVEFKVGSQKKYIIKDLITFSHLVLEGAVFEYGKNLKFYHERSAFTSDSLPILDFIMNRVQEFEYHFKQNQELYYTYRTMKALRELPLPDRCIDEFLMLLENRSVKLILNGMTDTVRLTSADPEFDFDISIDEQRGFKMTLPSYQLISGADELWVLKENFLFHCSREYTHDMKVFLESMDDLTDHTLFLPGKQMAAFCGSVYKKISRHLNVSHENIDLDYFMPPEAVFSIYLDCPETDVITCSAYAQYDHARYSLTDPINYGSGYRDAVREQKVSDAITAYFTRNEGKNPSVTEDFIIDHDDGRVFRLLEQGIPYFYQLGEVFIPDKMKNIRILSSPRASVGVSVMSDLLELEISSHDMPYEELAGILESYRRRKKFYRLKTGEYLRLENNSLSVLSELTDGLHLSDQEIREGRVRIPLYRAAYVDSVLNDHSADIQSDRDKYFKSLIRDLKSVKDSDYVVPSHIRPILRGYQKTGYRWLQTIAHLGFGGILADDMGLGKTLQIITLLSAAKQESDTPPCSLIICPSSLVYNWKNEFDRFAPEIDTLVITGSAADRQKLIASCQDHDVVITSYDTLKRDIDAYESLSFRYQIIDEAQYIKNHRTMSARAVGMIHSATRFALTGTPIENRLSELWSIFEYLMPGFLYPYNYFRSEIEVPVVESGDEIAAERLKQMVRPFILRRLKSDVLKELPEKIENAVYSQMTQEQTKLYEASVASLKAGLESQTDEHFKANRMQILSQLTRLRQICCDPSLVFEGYRGGSAKLDTCIQLIENAIAGGHKVLLFSQFTSMLDIIQQRLTQGNIAFFRLDGSTKSDIRTQLVATFNRDETPVFLISLKAGGTGLNLTGADIVIHYDPWWNVAAQNQATDRAHRIGQTKNVNVYKLIAGHSIEEQILKLQESKQALADRIISGEGMDSIHLTREDLLTILQS